MSNDIEIRKWIGHPLDKQVRRSLKRIASALGVKAIAVMPDVHLSQNVCIGVVLATDAVIYPEAVGGDIGCGVLAVKLDASADRIENERDASLLLHSLCNVVPQNRHRSASLPSQLPDELMSKTLTDDRLEKEKKRNARVQLGTLGRGNHFLEFQSDEDNQLWLVVHSGSRAMGQAITAHHLRDAEIDPASKLRFLRSNENEGIAYLRDMQWARQYAATNRLAMTDAVLRLLELQWRIESVPDSIVHTDHNHVREESHKIDGKQHSLFVHRKGAQWLAENEIGIVPGSMGASTFMVEGRANADALFSCSHGAGRNLSRTEARQSIALKDFQRQMNGVAFDRRKANRLRDESPSAYKDIRRVMKAQKDLVRIVGTHQPVLNFKGT